jgi:two-component sensor histidine kinase
MDKADRFEFLGHDGNVARLVRAIDWSSTGIGSVEDWPAPLKSAVAIMLHSAVPMIVLWGHDGWMIYNDAYAVIADRRHPSILGTRVREGWPEVADFTGEALTEVLAGRVLAFRDQELILHRNGSPQAAWFDIDYSPVVDDRGTPVGALAVVVETTERVLAERKNREEFERLRNLFEQAPTFMAMLSGADHRFDMINPEYRRLVGGRAIEGQSVAEALPEVAEQGFVSLLGEVFRSGQPILKIGQPLLLKTAVGGPLEERYLDFVYQPIRNEFGAVTHIFVQGSDVTERVRAEGHQKRLVNELNHRVKNTLASIQSIVSQTMRRTSSVEDAARSINARIMALSRAHNVLNAENWQGADLFTMIENALNVFRIEGREAIRISGPNIRVGPHAALSFALAMQELGSNAVQHGALSASTGLVQVHWAAASDGGFKLHWTETGGPPVVVPDHQGFGSRLILRLLPLEVRGTASIEYAQSGVAYSLETSLEAIGDRPSEVIS